MNGMSFPGVMKGKISLMLGGHTLKRQLERATRRMRNNFGYITI